MIPKKYERHMKNDARIAAVETTLINMNATMLAIHQDLNRLSDKMDTKFEITEHKFETRFQKIEHKLEDHDRKFEEIDKKFEKLETKMDIKFDAMQNCMWSNFLWLMGTMMGTTIGLAGLIARTQHWI